jgi:hypothetical protein
LTTPSSLSTLFCAAATRPRSVSYLCFRVCTGVMIVVHSAECCLIASLMITPLPSLSVSLALSSPSLSFSPFVLCCCYQLMERYEIARFSSTLEFLQLISRRSGKLKRGGTPDTDAAARTILQVRVCVCVCAVRVFVFVLCACVCVSV